MNETKPNRTTAPRPTKVEREARIAEVFKLLIIGLARHDILRYVAEKTTWGLKERAIDYLIAKASARFEAHAKVRRDQELGKAIARLNDLYSRTHRIQDYKTCIAIQRELNELLGLYAPKRMERSDEDGGPVSFVAVFPEPAASREEWSRQCKQEAAERERQGLEQQPQPPTGTTPA